MTSQTSGEVAARMLTAVLCAVHETGTDAVTVLGPVRDEADEVVDFEVLAATELVSALLGVDGPPVGVRLSQAQPDLAGRLIELNREVLLTGRAMHHEMELRLDGDGGRRRYGTVSRVAVDGVVVVLWSDRTEKHEARAALELSERRFRALVERSSDMIVTVDGDGVVSYGSPSVSSVGFTQQEVVGQHFSRFIHPEDVSVAARLMSATLQAPEGGSVQGLLRSMTATGNVRWMQVTGSNHLADPSVESVVFNIRDVTAHREAELLLQQQAFQDALTGLPNRRWFLDALRYAGARAERTGRPMAVLLIDVDNFKTVNDSLGHRAGDELLVTLAARMLAAVRPSDHVARLGGDEFVVLAEDLREEADAVAVSERLVATTVDRYTVDRLDAKVTLSIGVATASTATDPHTLLANADAAMYEAKRLGRNRIQVFDPTLRQQAMQRMQLQHEVHQALVRDEFVLHWQPIVRAADGAMTAAEALVRWQHPARGLLMPADFLPAVGDIGLMHDLCAWVITAALRQADAWSVLSPAPDVFINLDRRQLTVSTFPRDLGATASAFGVDPRRVSLELSERLLSDDLTAVTAPLSQLRDQGFGIALDDFGAGNTSLAWLQQLPIDLLKLDRRFTMSLGTPATDAIVRSLIDLSQILGISSVAEGVESDVQQRLLTEMGCEYLQGFHLARPQPAEQLTALLER
jgi:diguanylate cyclase (GGDEF)-like protein/PAS domain S-box-containing protein